MHFISVRLLEGSLTEIGVIPSHVVMRYPGKCAEVSMFRFGTLGHSWWSCTSSKEPGR